MIPSMPGDSSTEETVSPPQDLVISEVTAHSFRVSWTHASGSVEKYRVVYQPTRADILEEVTNQRLYALSQLSISILSNLPPSFLKE